MPLERPPCSCCTATSSGVCPCTALAAFTSAPACSKQQSAQRLERGERWKGGAPPAAGARCAPRPGTRPSAARCRRPSPPWRARQRLHRNVGNEGAIVAIKRDE
jgi:hypothetical protein